MFYIITGIVGLIVGSFLNVCIYRMPKEQSIVNPPSHCTKCNKNILWYDNIPVVSYIFLLGKCRFCKTKISPRYIIVELLTSGMFLFFVHFFGFTPLAYIYILMGCGLIISTFVDFEYQIIPDEISVGGLIVGFIISIIYPPLHGVETIKAALVSSLLGILVGGGSIYLIGAIGELIFKKESMGGGDVKLLAMVGAFIGWQPVLLAFFIAPFFGSIVGVILKITKKAEMIPYGPYLSLAAIISVIWWKDIVRLVLFR